jgi:hypothetical protein
MLSAENAKLLQNCMVNTPVKKPVNPLPISEISKIVLQVLARSMIGRNKQDLAG